MNRRQAITGLGVVVLTGVPSGYAQQAKKFARIGWLDPAKATAQARRILAFKRRLQELGRVEGQNVDIEFRFWQA